MANRVCFGPRNTGQPGLFVSRPGVNVLTASDADLILSTTMGSFQIVQSGKVNPVNNSGPGGGNRWIQISHVNLGYHPLVIFMCHAQGPGAWNSVEDNGLYYDYRHDSLTSVSLWMGWHNWSYVGPVTYAVTREPRDG